MTIPGDVARIVRQRAGNRCEYCRMHQSLQGATFHIEHVVPISRGGDSTLANLALACPGCNLRKSNRIETLDPQTAESVSLFNPRRDDWQDHFHWHGYYVVANTSVGRATVAALDFNHQRRLRIRQAEETLGLFPQP